MRDAEGKRVCIVQAWQYAQVIGELDVKFNADGDVLACAGTPHLLVSQLNTVNAVVANANADAIKATSSNDATIKTVMAALNQKPFAVVTPDAATNTVLKPFQDQKPILLIKLSVWRVKICALNVFPDKDAAR